MKGVLFVSITFTKEIETIKKFIVVGGITMSSQLKVNKKQLSRELLAVNIKLVANYLTLN